MKLTQLILLSSFFVGAMQVGAAPKKLKACELGNLGNVLYIGDSITHGFGAPSYRWALHKIFVDNGIEYNEIGIETGNHNPKTGVAEGATYIGRSFKNLHAAMSSERAYEVSGRGPQAKHRLDGTNIHNWFQHERGYDNKETDKALNDKRKLTDMPDTCFILLGTNDTLSDYGKKGGIGKNIKEAEKNLLDKKKGDMTHIVSTIQRVSPLSKIVLLTIPTWGQMKDNNTPADYAAIVEKYNKAFAKTFKKEIVVDVNEGLVDICSTEMPLRGVANFFNRDQLHPSVQGDLIMAGLVARRMGIAGRSAGLSRKPVEKFGTSVSDLMQSATEKDGVEQGPGKLAIQPGKKLVAPWPEGTDAKNGFSVEFTMACGDGAAGGWNMEPNTIISFGNGVHSGRLKLTDGYIRWQDDRVLLPIDLSKNKEAIRVTWHPGSESQNVGKGFYVWFGDMLIGEALPDDGTKFNGLSLENVSQVAVSVKKLAADAAPSAPATKNFVKEAIAVTLDEDKAQ